MATETTAVLEPRPPASQSLAARATGTFLALVLVGGLTKVVGFLREIVMAAQFGASRQMDAFLVAQTLPAAVQRVFDELLGATVLPLFAGWCLAAGEPAAWTRLSRLLRLFCVVCGGGVAAAMLLARPAIGLLAPGLGEAGTNVAARALQIMLPSVVFVVVGTICAALLNYYHRFLWAAGIALAGNVAALLCLVLYADRLGIYSAALGMTLSTLLVLLLQWWAVPKPAVSAPAVAPTRPWLAEFWRLAKPLGAGIALFNLIPLVERYLASWLPEGNIALLNYAFKVDWLVYMVFVLPITTMVFPRLAAAGAAADGERFQQVLVMALKAALLVLLPAMVFLWVAGDSVVRLLFERGNFTAAHTAATAAILKVYLLGLPGAAATLVLFYALYALKQPAGRVAAGALGLAVAGGCGWVSVGLWGARGIALTHAMNLSLIALLLGWFLQRSLGPVWWHLLGAFAARAFLAGVASVPLTWLAARALERAWPEASAVSEASRLLVCGVTTAGGFVGLCWLLSVGEIRGLASELRGHFAALVNSRTGVSR